MKRSGKGVNLFLKASTLRNLQRILQDPWQPELTGWGNLVTIFLNRSNRTRIMQLRMLVPVRLSFAFFLVSGPATAQVQQAWAARYDSTNHSADRAVALAADSAGNIYVTGGAHTGTQWDYATMSSEWRSN